MQAKQTNTKTKIVSKLYDAKYYLSESCPGYKSYLKGDVRLSKLQIALLKYGDISPNMVTLDFGCGRGELLVHLAKAGNRVLGIDYSYSALKYATELRARQDDSVKRRIFLINTRAGKLPFIDNCFDRIFMVDVIEHLYLKEERIILKEFHRILKPNGALIIHTINRLDYDIAWKCYIYYIARIIKKVKGKKMDISRDKRIETEKKFHINEKDPKNLKEILVETGFTKVSIKPRNIYEEVNLSKYLFNEFILYLRAISWLPPLSHIFNHSLFAIGVK